MVVTSKSRRKILKEYVRALMHINQDWEEVPMTTRYNEDERLEQDRRCLPFLIIT
jgi:hypothetical protein